MFSCVSLTDQTTFFVMVQSTGLGFSPNDNGGGGSASNNARRRGGIIYAPGSAEASWVANAAAEASTLTISEAQDRELGVQSRRNIVFDVDVVADVVLKLFYCLCCPAESEAGRNVY